MEIPSTDGFTLAATLFQPDGPPAGVIQINSASAVPRQFYRHYAVWLTKQGLAVVTFDYRGINDSIPGDIKDVEGEIRDWGEKDAAGITDWCSSQFPGLDLFGIGHSIGGTMLGLQPNSHRFRRLLCIASQSGYWGIWPGESGELRRRILQEMLPDSIAEHGYLRGEHLGRRMDLPSGIARSWARWCCSPFYVSGDDGRPLREPFHRVTAPMQFVAFTDDDTAPLNGVEAMIGCYANAPTRLDILDPCDHGLSAIGHFDYFRQPHAVLWPRTRLRLTGTADTKG